MYCFEVGHTYGNWQSALTRTVIARTAHYVTFNGGMRKRVTTVLIGDRRTEVVAYRTTPGLNVYAACIYD
jgi:hypothetical protein